MGHFNSSKVTAFLATQSNRHTPVLPRPAIPAISCENCRSVLHRPPRVPYEQQSDGPACDWVGRDELRLSIALNQLDGSFPTKRHWHHHVHSIFGLPCDSLCKSSPVADRARNNVPLIERIKTAYRIEDIAGRITELQGNGATLTGRCPLHGEKRGRAFVVWSESQRWRCFGACGAGGDVIDLVRECESRGIDWLGRSAKANGGSGWHRIPERGAPAERRP